jgi:hypothetical protein
MQVGRRPLVGAQKREEEARTKKVVEHAQQTAMHLARRAGWTVKDPLQHTREAVRIDVEDAVRLLRHEEPLRNASHAAKAPQAVGGGVGGGGGSGGSMSQQEAVAAFLETGSWAGMSASGTRKEPQINAEGYQ